MKHWKNSKGESHYIFGWLTAPPKSRDFKSTTGGNSVWAKTKREAIAKVNRERREFEKENPTHCRLRVDEKTCRRVSYETARAFDSALYSLTI